MEIFFIINQILFIWLTCYFPYYYTKFFKLSIINPITILFIITVPVEIFKTFIGPFFFLEKSLLNPYFNYAILITNISLLTKLLTTIFFFKYFKSKKKFINNLNAIKFKFFFSPLRMKRISRLFFFFFLICFIILASHSFGVINWLMNPRVGYQLHRTGVGAFYALSLTFLSLSYTIRLLYTKSNWKIYTNSLFYFICVWFLGSKGFLLSFTGFFFIILWCRKNKNIKRILFLCIPFVFLVLLLNLGRTDFEEIAEYFDYYINSANYYEAYLKGEIDLFYGKIALTDLWGLVPRGLYPDKPYVYGFLYVNEFFFPGAAEATNTPAFGGPIAAFADFGIIGVIISSIFNFEYWFRLLMLFLLYQKFNYHIMKTKPLLLFIFILLYAPAFLTFIGFPLSLFMFLLVFFIISVGNRIVIFKHNKV